jgi:type II secretory pathway pseudopilin PulG
MRKGFTLVELLISMILIILLLTALSIIFGASTEAVNTGEARIDVYTQQRFAMDRIQTDLLGCMNFIDGRQAFILENGYINGMNIVYPAPTAITNWQNNVGKAADRMTFRTISSVGDTTAQCQVTYQLLPYADTSRQRGSRSGRPIFVLVRQVRLPNPASPKNYTVAPTDSAGGLIDDEEVAHFVTSFNIEYYCDMGKYAQLEPTPCPVTDPLGDGLGANDLPPTGYRIPKVRITMQVIDDAGERQERTIVRDMWIPTGN